ncbi:hypothetical protein J2Y69_001761 [Microbacterium resistens]|uniref:DUF2975 domain-containing protein n=1 Tax=Microbacterium resistens TaxID=156977 RepID=A0ABU1SC15_9MICO|nr:hypothetical protein [Microbacterium resistens]MDR6867162.1 hypothetical protein [Microbacterium resistens]
MISLSGDDAWSALAQIGIALLVLAAIAGIVIWRGMRKGRKTIVLDVAYQLASWVAMIAVIGLVLGVLNALTASTISVGPAPLPPSWPSTVPCLESNQPFTGRPSIVCGALRMSDVWVADPGMGVRVLAAGSRACGSVLIALPAALISLMCHQALRGHPFHESVAKYLFIGAGTALVIGIASDLLTAITGVTALREILAPEDPGYPQSMLLTLTPFPFAFALALAALGVVFRYGSRLQRDTEGLV